MRLPYVRSALRYYICRFQRPKQFCVIPIIHYFSEFVELGFQQKEVALFEDKVVSINWETHF